jgi:hypothetical protein
MTLWGEQPDIQERALREAISGLAEALTGVVRAATNAQWTGPAARTFEDELNARRHELRSLVSEAEARADQLRTEWDPDWKPLRF